MKMTPIAKVTRLETRSSESPVVVVLENQRLECKIMSSDQLFDRHVESWKLAACPAWLGVKELLGIRRGEVGSLVLGMQTTASCTLVYQQLNATESVGAWCFSHINWKHHVLRVCSWRRRFWYYFSWREYPDFAWHSISKHLKSFNKKMKQFKLVELTTIEVSRLRLMKISWTCWIVYIFVFKAMNTILVYKSDFIMGHFMTWETVDSCFRLLSNNSELALYSFVLYVYTTFRKFYIIYYKYFTTPFLFVRLSCNFSYV